MLNVDVAENVLLCCGDQRFWCRVSPCVFLTSSLFLCLCRCRVTPPDGETSPSGAPGCSDEPSGATGGAGAMAMPATSTLSLPMSQGKPSLRRIKGRIHRSKSLDSIDLLDSNVSLDHTNMDTVIIYIFFFALFYSPNVSAIKAPRFEMLEVMSNCLVFALLSGQKWLSDDQKQSTRIIMTETERRWRKTILIIKPTPLNNSDEELYSARNPSLSAALFPGAFF